MYDRFKMSREENVMMAKRILVDSIYQQANLEGIAVTFAQTQDILNNVNVSLLTPIEINKICCLRDGWNYLLDSLDEPVDLIFIEKLHKLVARFDIPYRYLGKLRTNDVLISGTKWRPDYPDVDVICEKLSEVSEIECVTERAITTGLWLMRCQPFLDGNKRVGSFCINKIMIANGVGIFNVPVDLDRTFQTMLVKFYETDDGTDIMTWIVNNCLDGINEIW